MEENNKQQISNGEVSEAVAAIEDKPADNDDKPTKAKTKKDKKRD